VEILSHTRVPLPREVSNPLKRIFLNTRTDQSTLLLEVEYYNYILHPRWSRRLNHRLEWGLSMQRQTALQRNSARTDRRTVPTTLSAPRSKLVWFAIATGANTPDGLRDQLDIPLLSIYPILNSLRRHGHICWDDDTVSLTDSERGGAD
jgi:hypothetical protein